MKNFLSFLILLNLLAPAYSQKGWRDHEMEVRVNISTPDEAIMLYNLHLNGDIHAPAGYALMYIVPAELERLQGTGLSLEVLKHDLNEYYKDFWLVNSEQYHNYDQIIALMDSLATVFPGICQKTVFGLTPQGRQLTCLKISANVSVDENEPEVLFDAGIHGDEIGGPENLIRFARYLCTSYGSDQEITDLLNNRAITIYPMVNPDGRANMSRYNSNNVDCNRDWGYMWNSEGNSPAAFSQLETRTLRNCFYNHRFVIHMAYHSGEEVVLYPWCYRSAQAPDFTALHQLASIYSTSSGYTNLQYRQSYADYPTNGETIDYSYGADGTDALTMEISTSKQPPTSQIQYYYQNNVPAMIEMIKNAGYGISGTITDSITGMPVEASIFVNNFFPVYTDPAVGDYHKFLTPGTYSMKIVANNYLSKVINNVVVDSLTSTVINLQLQPSTGHYASKVAAVVIPGNNPMDVANTPGVVGAPDSIWYSTGKNGWITVDMQDSVVNIPGDDFMVYEGDNSLVKGYTCLVGQTIDGPWVSLGSGTGTQAFDMGSTGLSSARFIKIVDDGDGPQNAAGAGFDLDAIESLEQTTGIRTTDGKPGTIKVYPNPANEKITFDFQRKLPEETIISLFDINGKQIIQDKFRNQNPVELDVRTLSKGIYMVKFQTSAGIENKKLVIY